MQDTFSVRPININDLENLTKWVAYYQDRGINFIVCIKNQRDIERWYAEYLKDEEESQEGNYFLVVSYNDKDVAVVSFEGCEEDKECQIFMIPEYKSKGLGLSCLLIAEGWIRNKCKKLEFLRANIEADNIPSCKIFKAAGYNYDMSDWCKSLEKYDPKEDSFAAQIRRIKEKNKDVY